jgi:hypothetical protein
MRSVAVAPTPALVVTRSPATIDRGSPSSRASNSTSETMSVLGENFRPRARIVPSTVRSGVEPGCRKFAGPEVVLLVVKSSRRSRPVRRHLCAAIGPRPRRGYRERSQRSTSFTLAGYAPRGFRADVWSSLKPTRSGGRPLQPIECHCRRARRFGLRLGWLKKTTGATTERSWCERGQARTASSGFHLPCSHRRSDL